MNIRVLIKFKYSYDFEIKIQRRRILPVKKYLNNENRYKEIKR